MHRAADVELDLTLGEFVNDIASIGQRSDQPIELGHDQCVAGAARAEGLTQPGPGPVGSSQAEFATPSAASNNASACCTCRCAAVCAREHLAEQDLIRLSPLGHAHLNELGRYRFPVLTPGTGLRPLRDPGIDDDR